MMTVTTAHLDAWAGHPINGSIVAIYVGMMVLVGLGTWWALVSLDLLEKDATDDRNKRRG